MRLSETKPSRTVRSSTGHGQWHQFPAVPTDAPDTSAPRDATVTGVTKVGTSTTPSGSNEFAVPGEAITFTAGFDLPLTFFRLSLIRSPTPARISSPRSLICPWPMTRKPPSAAGRRRSGFTRPFSSTGRLQQDCRRRDHRSFHVKGATTHIHVRWGFPRTSLADRIKSSGKEGGGRRFASPVTALCQGEPRRNLRLNKRDNHERRTFTLSVRSGL
jgi:hypothetical protein